MSAKASCENCGKAIYFKPSTQTWYHTATAVDYCGVPLLTYAIPVGEAKHG